MAEKGLEGRFVEHRKRLRDRFQQEGLDHFEQHNQLELLLFYSIPRKDTNGIAHDLIDRFGSISRVMDASFEELMQVKGVGENTATLLKLIPALARSYLMDSQAPHQVLTTLPAIKEYLEALYTGCTKERVYLLLLDNRGALLKTVFLGEGDLTGALLSPREVVRTALFGKTTSVILSHNHPAGFALPSHQDFRLTEEIKNVLRSVDITLIDHVIVSGNGDCYSMAQSCSF